MGIREKQKKIKLGTVLGLILSGYDSYTPSLLANFDVKFNGPSVTIGDMLSQHF
jgi:hypothetical protein